MRQLATTVIACLAALPGVQAQSLQADELEQLFERVAARQPGPPPDLDRLGARPGAALQALDSALGDPRPRVREYATRIMIELGSRTREAHVRRQALECVWERVADPDSMVVATALRGLARFGRDDFNEGLRAKIVTAMETATTRVPWIRAAGACGGGRALESLRRMAEGGDGPIARAAWLSAARLGDEGAVDRVTTWVQDARSFARVAEDLVWTRQPRAIRRVAEALHGTERMPGITPHGRGLPLAQYAAHALTRHLPDAPVTPKPTGTFSRDEIELLQRWSKERYP